MVLLTQGNHLPLLETQFLPATSTVDFQRFYPQLRLYGGDVAIPLRWVTLKGEAAYYTSRTAEAEEYAIYVVQLERQAGDWSLVGGYAGEEVTRSTGTADFSPDRGLARAFLGRAGYTFGPRANLSVEAVVRQNGEGVWVTFEYSRLLSRHWRVTASYTHIDGDATDFIGQYHRNSHAILALRYSF